MKAFFLSWRCTSVKHNWIKEGKVKIYFQFFVVFVGHIFPIHFFSPGFLNQLRSFWKATAFKLFYKICSHWHLEHMQGTCLFGRDMVACLLFLSFLLPPSEAWAGSWGREEQRCLDVSADLAIWKIALCMWGLAGLEPWPFVGAFKSCLLASLLGLQMWRMSFPLDADCLWKFCPHRQHLIVKARPKGITHVSIWGRHRIPEEYNSGVTTHLVLPKVH